VYADAQSERVRRFERQILMYLDDLYRVAFRLTEHAADAEDLVQETCVRAFKALDQLRHPAAAKVWLFSILRSIFLRQAERTPSRAAVLSLEDVDAARLVPSEVQHDAREGFLPLRQALVQETRQAILWLPLRYREVVILAHIGGFSYREVARIMRVPTGTVMSRLCRGRRMLRSYLAERPSGSESRDEM
jgi:RNA polymerase sigma-70 factor (ECF subfamily)